MKQAAQIPRAKATTTIDVKSTPAEIITTQKQIDALAIRLMPEIKRFFADEQIQREFREWKENQKSYK
jgi:hypothetical protein